MKGFKVLFVIIAVFICQAQAQQMITPSRGLSMLMEGNQRYVSDQSEHPNRSGERRKELASKQLPYAVIVGCSDSRVAPEIIFDQGLGDLFVVRIAGNIIGQTELESIKYSALYLGSSIIVVLGHENCGAVNAVVQGNTGDITEIAEFIEPSVLKARQSKSPDLLERAIKLNALNMARDLKNTPNLQRLIKNNQLEVRAAYYNLKTGLVELLNM